MENKDTFYHQKSLVLAKMFKDLYERHGIDNPLVKEMRERYIEARRQISVDEKTGERHGAREAFLATQ